MNFAFVTSEPREAKNRDEFCCPQLRKVRNHGWGQSEVFQKQGNSRDLTVTSQGDRVILFFVLFFFIFVAPIRHTENRLAELTEWAGEI